VSRYATHPLAKRKRLAFAETLPHEQIDILSGSMVQATLRREAAVANQTLRHRIQVSTFDAACRNVAAGLGIAVVPREAAETFARALALRARALDRCVGGQRRFVICMRSRESLTAAARLLVDYLCQRANEKP